MALGKPKSASPRPARRPSRRATGLPNLRLLPVTIFVAALMLSVRGYDIWKGLTGFESMTLSVNRSEAQQPPPPGGRKRGQQSPQTPTDVTTTGATPSSTDAAPGSPPPASPSPPGAADSAASPSAAAGGEGEPPTFTQSELDVLQKLSVRREALDARQRDLDLRENLVKAAEARIDKKIAEMKSLQTNVEAILKQVDNQDDDKMKSLVKIYENMKPKDAAKIFEALDMPVLLGVVTRMKEQKVAPIMEVMDPLKAKTITDSMAVRRAARAEGQGG
jgi:flagellar motility protein MotE (MotC chaperone)